MAKSPLERVKEAFGDKAKLVAAIEKLTGEELWIARTHAGKGLGHVSNAKLLRLHETFTQVKDKFGTREKLVVALLELEKRGKDAGLREKLLQWPVPRLYDAYRSALKRSSAGAKPPAASAKPKAAAAAAAKPAKKTAKKAKATAAKGAKAGR